MSSLPGTRSDATISREEPSIAVALAVSIPGRPMWSGIQPNTEDFPAMQTFEDWHTISAATGTEGYSGSPCREGVITEVEKYTEQLGTWH